MYWHGGRIDWGDRSQVKVEWPLFRRALGYFKPHWKVAIGVIACIAFGSVVSLAPAWSIQQLIQHAFTNFSYGLIVFLVAVSLLGTALDSLSGVLQSYLRAQISQGIMYDLRHELFGRMLKQSVSFFTRSRTGDVMSRLSNDVSGIQDVVSGTVFDAISNIGMFTAAVIYMAVQSWQLTLVALAVVPLFALPTRRVGTRTFLARKDTQAQLSKVTAFMQETIGISGVLLVKAFGKERSEMARFRGLTDELRRLEIRQTMVGRWFFMIMRLLGSGGPAVIFLAGFWLVKVHLASPAVVLTFGTVLLGRLYGPVSTFAGLQVNVIGSLALFQRIFEYIDLPFEVDEKPDAKPLEPGGGRVTFEGVTFSYRADAPPALENVAFEIQPGQLAALVGPSGAGKTTVTSLVPRFYDPQQGRVLIDGQDVRDVTLESLAAQLGIVFQDTFLFHDTVRANLLYARPGATQDEMVAAARAANIHDFIESLPDGYETIVGERGHRLSGGEKQRMAIARVILRDPRILILDEATSNLDSESEHLIQAALRPLMQDRTSIVIAHRLSTILAADVILVLDGGKLVEQGTHFELLQRGGLYAKLYERQFAAAERAVV
ncbi:MAG TPA: ABC transporter ATP-binding protein [Candidatus Dormibacteraeota bacterium]